MSDQWSPPEEPDGERSPADSPATDSWAADSPASEPSAPPPPPPSWTDPPAAPPPTGSWAPPPGSSYPPPQPPQQPFEQTPYQQQPSSQQQPPPPWGAPPSYPPLGQPYAPPGYGGYGGYGPNPYAPAPNEGMAIAALVVAICQYVVCWFIPLLAPVALVLASNASSKIRASGGRLQGEGMAKAARIMSWIYLGLAAVGILLAVIIAAAGGFDTEPTYEDPSGEEFEFRWILPEASGG